MQLNWKNFLLVTLVVSSCSTNEELTNNPSLGLDTIPEPIEVDLNDSRYLLAKHVSNDKDVEVFFLEIEGEVVTSIQYDLTSDLHNLRRHIEIIDQAKAKNISLDQLYAQMAGPSADSRSVAKLKRAQKRMDSEMNNAVEPLSEEQGQLLLDRFERHANARNEALEHDRNTSERAQICVTSPQQIDQFNEDICNGSAVQYCFLGEGVSTAPQFTGQFYRLYFFNPNLGGDVTTIAYVGSSKSTFIFSVKHNQMQIHDFWGRQMQTRVSRVSSTHPNCRYVAHAVHHELFIVI